MTPRAIAAGLLDRIGRGGAYSNVVIRSATEGLAGLDRRFVQRLVFGAVRHQLRIDRALASVTSRPLSGIDPLVLAALRIGGEEALFLGTPPHALVDGAVTAVAENGRTAAKGFANAVLRALVAAGEPAMPNGAEGTALRLGVPPWLLAQVVDSLGVEGAEAFLEASNRDAPIGLRRRGSVAVPGDAVPGIPGAHLGAEADQVGAAVASGAGAVADPASVAVGLAVAAEPGMVVADLAAAPGGKTLHLWDSMEGRGTLVAADRHARRARDAARRLGAGPRWIVADARRPPLAPGRFDRVLLDAPCTGLGTLRRRPEIRHRLRPSSSAEAGRRQRAMVEAAIPLLRKGGRLVYSVCTVLVAETVDVVAGLGAEAPADLPGRSIGDGLLLGPHLTATDGMFIAVVQR